MRRWLQVESLERTVEVVDNADVVAVDEYLSVALFKVNSDAAIAGTDSGHDVPGARVTVRSIATAVPVAVSVAVGQAKGGARVPISSTVSRTVSDTI